MMKTLFIVFVLLISTTVFAQSVSFTFDDGSLGNMPGYSLQEWNSMLLNKLDKAGVKTMLFVMGKDKNAEKGHYLLNSWNKKGHKIAGSATNVRFFLYLRIKKDGNYSARF